jgi:hypothetical protein
MALTRQELVEFVREVLGEVKRAESVSGTYQLRLYENATALAVTFVLDGREIVGEYLIPLPSRIMELAEDRERNPWRTLVANVQVGTQYAGPTMREVERPAD